MQIRVGHGYDVHILTEGRALMLGCVHVPHPLGLLGHSDADVLAHAIADALLGAAALGDIGRHFPDSDPAYKNMSGESLLSRTAVLIREAGFAISNIDATLVAQKPKIAPFIDAMRDACASALSIHKDDINIKATTEEGRGITGNADAMCAHAVCLLVTEK